MALVDTEDRGAVRHVVLNRSDRANAMDGALLGELGTALWAAADDPDVACVVLRGTGPTFSTGADLDALAIPAGGPGRAFRRRFLACATACEEMVKPVVCQIHGRCLGGALEIALACDLRIAAADARLGLPEVRFGVVPDVGGLTRLPALVGLGRAKELVMTGRTIDASEAEHIGLVQRVVPAARLDGATRELTDALLANPTVAVGRAKRVLDLAARPGLSASLELEVAVQEHCLAIARTTAEAGPGLGG